MEEGSTHFKAEPEKCAFQGLDVSNFEYRKIKKGPDSIQLKNNFIMQNIWLWNSAWVEAKRFYTVFIYLFRFDRDRKTEIFRLFMHIPNASMANTGPGWRQARGSRLGLPQVMRTKSCYFPSWPWTSTLAQNGSQQDSNPRTLISNAGLLSGILTAMLSEPPVFIFRRERK